MTDTPRVQPDSFVTLHYRLAGPAGDIINTFLDKPATLSLGTGALNPSIEQQLVGMAEGAHQTLSLASDEAFGPRNEAMVQWVARKLLNEWGDPAERYAVGEVVQFPAPMGQGNYAGVVRELRNVGQDNEALLFDFNHPLAGQPVEFEVKIIGVL